MVTAPVLTCSQCQRRFDRSSCRTALEHWAPATWTSSYETQRKQKSSKTNGQWCLKQKLACPGVDAGGVRLSRKRPTRWTSSRSPNIDSKVMRPLLQSGLNFLRTELPTTESGGLKHMLIRRCKPFSCKVQPRIFILLTTVHT